MISVFSFTNTNNFHCASIMEQPNTLLNFQNNMLYKFLQPPVSYIYPEQNRAQLKLPFNNVSNKCYHPKNHFAKLLPNNCTRQVKPTTVLNTTGKFKRNKICQKLSNRTQVNKFNESKILIENKVYSLCKSSCEIPFLRKYSVEKQLGKGGQGTVFLATNLQNGRKVAVKCKKIRPRTVKEEWKGDMLPKEVVIQMQASSDDSGLCRL